MVGILGNTISHIVKVNELKAEEGTVKNELNEKKAELGIVGEKNNAENIFFLIINGRKYYMGEVI